MTKIVAGTGHRPDKLGGYGISADAKVFRFALDTLQWVAPSYVISGMAQGWDMALAKAAKELGIPYTAAVPFPGQDKPWPAYVQRQYRDLLGHATMVIEVSPEFSYQAYQRRNIWMVNNCATVLALWNGTKGGTGNCVEYAKQAEKQIVNVWERWETFA